MVLFRWLVNVFFGPNLIEMFFFNALSSLELNKVGYTDFIEFKYVNSNHLIDWVFEERRNVFVFILPTPTWTTFFSNFFFNLKKMIS